MRRAALPAGGRAVSVARHNTCALKRGAKDIMQINKNNSNNPNPISRFLHGLSKPEKPQGNGTLSRHDLQRIVAAMVG